MKITADQHVHDRKALLELIENIIKLNSMTTAIGKLFADDGAYEGNEVLHIRETMESCHASK
jgi:hypothetical protein